eukprot:gene10233-2389_t
METAVREQFTSLGITLDDDNIIGKCCELCHRFGLEPLDLAVKWNAYFMAQGLPEKPTLPLLENLAQDISRNLSKKTTPKRPTVHYDKSSIGEGLANALVSSFGLTGEIAEAIKASSQKSTEPSRKRMSFSSPQALKRSVGGLTGSPQSITPTKAPNSSDGGSPRLATYATRTNAGHIELTFNPGGKLLDRKADTPIQPVQLSVFPTTLEKPYRYMFEKLNDRAEVLDMRIEDLGKLIISRHKLHSLVIGEEENKDTTKQPPTAQEIFHALNSVAHVCQDRTLIIGRICVDATEGKLNSSSIALEMQGCFSNSQGKRIPLNINEMRMYSLFPGQIIAAEGRNPTGDVFVPTNIFEGAPAPRKKTKAKELLNLYFSSSDSGDDTSIGVMAVAGPYTTNQDMTYAPLEDFLRQVVEKKPQVVIFSGPFVDARHPLIMESEFEESFEDVLHFVIDQIVTVIAGMPQTHAVIIPSLYDVTHDFIFPQAPFQSIATKHERLHLLANPSTFVVNELTFAVTSADVLFDLSRAETSRNMQSERMLRLVNHLIEQRSLYPLEPASENVHLDYAHIDNIKLPVTPDVIILPSTLRHFISDVNGSLAVNPGHLTRLSSGGTYAYLLIHCPRRNDIPETNKPMFSGVVERTACRIIQAGQQQCVFVGLSSPLEQSVLDAVACFGHLCSCLIIVNRTAQTGWMDECMYANCQVLSQKLVQVSSRRSHYAVEIVDRGLSIQLNEHAIGGWGSDSVRLHDST